MTIKIRLQITFMTDYEITRHGTVISFGVRHLFIAGFHIRPNTIDKILDDTLLTIYQYLINHFDYLSFGINKSNFYIHIGTFYNQNRDININLNIIKNIKQHLEYIIPHNFSVFKISGYRLPVSYFKKKLFEKDNLIIGDKITTFFDLSNLEVIDFHSKIMKLLLEIPDLTILLTWNKLVDESFNFCIQFQSVDITSIISNEQKLIANLQRTPYFSGKLTKIRKHTLKKTPGKILLGITPNQITPNEFTSFLKLLPKVINIPHLPKIPHFYPLVDLDQSPSLTETHLDVENKISEKSDSPPISEVPRIDSEFINRLLGKIKRYNWEIVSRNNLPTGLVEFIIKNHDIYVKLTTNHSKITDTAIQFFENSNQLLSE